MMTGAGFDLSLLGGFGMAWMGLVILFFIFIFGKRWVFEELLQLPFNAWIGFGAGALLYMLSTSILCSPRWGFIIGLLAGLTAGYFGGMVVEQS